MAIAELTAVLSLNGFRIGGARVSWLRNEDRDLSMPTVSYFYFSLSMFVGTSFFTDFFVSVSTGIRSSESGLVSLF